MTETITEALTYDPTNGKLYWNAPFSSGRRPGEAGSINKDGYRVINHKGQRYLAHRLVWLFHHGNLPSTELDHINRIKDDNRIENLRECTRSENQFNRDAWPRKHALPKGIYFINDRIRSKPYQLRQSENGKTKHVGNFATVEQALAAQQLLFQGRDMVRKNSSEG